MSAQIDAGDLDLGWLAGQVAQAPPRCGAVRVVVVDGGAASGKTTLADALGRVLDAPVLHTDLMLAGWDGQFSFWTRLQTDVLAPLSEGRTGCYRRYDWVADRFAETVLVPVEPVLIVEGVSASTGCGRYTAYSILRMVPRRERERRWSERDGAALAPEWVRWLDREDEYFAKHPLDADLVVRG
jgi:uridine kinase